MYYRCAVDLKREMLTDHASDGYCTRSGKCIGHFAGDILARVISRMLYVTLPARGFLPLVKSDAVRMSIEAYGRSSCRPVALSMNVLKRDRNIRFNEYKVMFPFSRKLFRECIRICGRKNHEVMKALRDNAEFYKQLSKEH